MPPSCFLTGDDTLQPSHYPDRAGTGPAWVVSPRSFGQHPCCGLIYGVSLVSSSRLSVCSCNPLPLLPCCAGTALLTPALPVLPLPSRVRAPLRALCTPGWCFLCKFAGLQWWQRASCLILGVSGAVSEALHADAGATRSRLFPRSTWGMSPHLCTEGGFGAGEASP